MVSCLDYQIVIYIQNKHGKTYTSLCRSFFETLKIKTNLKIKTSFIVHSFLQNLNLFYFTCDPTYPQNFFPFSAEKGKKFLRTRGSHSASPPPWYPPPLLLFILTIKINIKGLCSLRSHNPLRRLPPATLLTLLKRFP